MHHWFAVPVLLVATLFQDPAPRPAAPPATLRPAVMITGARSAVTKTEYLRVRSAQDLARAWLRHVGETASGTDHDFFYNHAGVPEVDFDAFEVLVIFGGETVNSAGFTVISTADEPARRLVRFDHKSYQTEGPGGGGKRATPFAFVVLARTGAPIVLEENVQSMIGRPPEWKERARL